MHSAVQSPLLVRRNYAHQGETILRTLRFRAAFEHLKASGRGCIINITATLHYGQLRRGSPPPPRRWSMARPPISGYWCFPRFYMGPGSLLPHLHRDPPVPKSAPHPVGPMPSHPRRRSNAVRDPCDRGELMIMIVIIVIMITVKVMPTTKRIIGATQYQIHAMAAKSAIDAITRCASACAPRRAGS